MFIPPAWLILWLFVLMGIAYADPIRPVLFTPEESTLLHRLAFYWVVTSLAHFAELSSQPLETRLSIDRRVWRCLLAGFVGVSIVGFLRDSGKIKKIGEEIAVLAVTAVAYEAIARGINVWVSKRLGGGEGGEDAEDDRGNQT